MYRSYLESNMIKKMKDKTNRYADSRKKLTEEEKYNQMGARKLETAVSYPECDMEKKAKRALKDAGNLAFKTISKAKGQDLASTNGVQTTVIE